MGWDVFLSKLVAIGCDGTAVVVGKRGGVASLLQKEQEEMIVINSSAMTIHRAMNQCLSTITKYKTRSILPSQRWSQWNLRRRGQVLRLLQQKIQTLPQEKMSLTAR
ncbi:hypothetical protein AAFF_G00121740 [Aldrovandia affinis]|uniref:Uncharacterized protein n=1 Tax=Aldrovandia affinis TaxID=143900 RepID=A0AAD7WAZ5_9TELE|nr:hypothetical protein AAFF_G00121740 [Aldrovandia affinis]